MIDPSFVSLCHLIATKERMNAFVEGIDRIISEQSQNTDFVLSEAYFSHDEFYYIKELVKNYTDLKALRKRIFEVPILYIQIAFIPSQQFISKMTSLFQSNIKEPFFIEVRVNAGIIGGCVIEFKGMYNDRSLKRDVTKWMKARALNHGR